MPAVASMLALVLSVHPGLVDGRRLSAELKYGPAEAALRTARASTELSPAERVETLDLLARALLAQLKTEEAESVYVELLSNFPNITGPEEAAPKVASAFTRARNRLYPRNHVKLLQRAAPDGFLEFDLVDPWKNVSALVFSEAEGTGAFSSRRLPRQDRTRVELGPSTSPRRWYLEAHDNADTTVASLGTADAPYVVSVLAGDASARAPSQTVTDAPAWWPVWTAAGVAVASAAVGTGLAVLSTNDAAASNVQPFASDRYARYQAAHGEAVGANVLIGSAIAAAVATGILVLLR